MQQTAKHKRKFLCINEKKNLVRIKPKRMKPFTDNMAVKRGKWPEGKITSVHEPGGGWGRRLKI